MIEAYRRPLDVLLQVGLPVDGHRRHLRLPVVVRDQVVLAVGREGGGAGDCRVAAVWAGRAGRGAVALATPTPSVGKQAGGRARKGWVKDWKGWVIEGVGQISRPTPILLCVSHNVSDDLQQNTRGP